MSALKNWREEKGSAYLYEIIADTESDPKIKKLFLDLAATANKQADIWKRELEKTHQKIPTFKPNLRTRFIAWLTTKFGAKNLRIILSAMKVRGMSIYTSNYPYDQLAGTLTHENRHTSINSAGNLRAAVFGVNDGLISNISLILGVAGAQANHHFIILSGVAGLLAGACSMGAGEYISVRSQREFFEYQIALEKSELEEYPEEEAMELALIYEARGLPKDEANRVAHSLINNPKNALDTLAREELGLNPNELGSPWGAAIFSFLAFSMGASIPLIPFLFGDYVWNFALSISLTSLSLFLIGATLSLFTNRSALASGLRMLLIGALAGSLTYAIGNIIGVKLG